MIIDLMAAFGSGLAMYHRLRSRVRELPAGPRQILPFSAGLLSVIPIAQRIHRHGDADESGKKHLIRAYLLACMAFVAGIATGWFLDALQGTDTVTKAQKLYHKRNL